MKTPILFILTWFIIPIAFGQKTNQTTQQKESVFLSNINNENGMQSRTPYTGATQVEVDVASPILLYAGQNTDASYYSLMNLTNNANTNQLWWGVGNSAAPGSGVLSPNTAFVVSDFGGDLGFGTDQGVAAHSMFFDHSAQTIGLGTVTPGSFLHIDANANNNALRLDADTGTTMEFFTGNTSQFRIRKLGNGTGDFQFSNMNNSTTSFTVSGLARMAILSTGKIAMGTGAGAFSAQRQLQVNGNADAEFYEVKIQDTNFAFLEFDAALQSGIAFNDGAANQANVWYRGNGIAGLIMNTTLSSGQPDLFVSEATGFVGVNTDVPDAYLDIEGTSDGANFGDRIGAAWGYLNVQRPSAATNPNIARYRDYNTTKVEINPSASTYQLVVNGAGFVTSGVWTASDQRLKQNISNLEDNTLTKLMSLSPKSYTFKTDAAYNFLDLPEGNQIGFLAQDVKNLFPEAVTETTMTDADGDTKVDHQIHSVNYEMLIPVLTKAIQEQQATIQALEARIEALENK